MRCGRMANFNVPLLLFVSVLWMLGAGGEGMKFTDDEVALQEPNKAPLEAKTCNDSEFQCDAEHCIPELWHCDGESNCADGSDEQNCGHGLSCQEGYFRCELSRNCISNDYICDGIYDCGEDDFSDEHNCSGPSNIRFIPSTKYYSLPSGSYMPLVMCMADCNTTCTYKWTKNGMYIARQTLNIGRLSSSDSGTYTCTASEGTKLVTKSLTLYVPPDPSNIQFIPSTTYYSLQSGSFMPLVMCMADCNTTCTYKWTKNGMYIARQTLNVSRVSSSSAGTYTCTASEGTKSVTKSLRLYVPSDPSNIRFIPSATYYSLPSGSFMPLVMCMADCNTNCTYKWTKNRIDIAGQILRVYKISSSSAGTYTCTASEGTKVVMKSLLLDVPYNDMTTTASCHHWQFQCNNGLCIERYQLCDGYDDCGDFSDEQYCRHNYYRDYGTIHIPLDVVIGVTGTFIAIVIALAVVLVVLLKRHRRMRRSQANKQHMSSSDTPSELQTIWIQITPNACLGRICSKLLAKVTSRYPSAVSIIDDKIPTILETADYLPECQMPTVLETVTADYQPDKQIPTVLKTVTADYQPDEQIPTVLNTADDQPLVNA